VNRVSPLVRHNERSIRFEERVEQISETGSDGQSRDGGGAARAKHPAAA
jgi:hypothetical protein